MLTVKFVKYGPGVADQAPAPLEAISIRQAASVHLRFEKDGRQVLQCGDAPGETWEATVGLRNDCRYTLAYIMNEAGKTVDTIR